MDSVRIRHRHFCRTEKCTPNNGVEAPPEERMVTLDGDQEVAMGRFFPERRFVAGFFRRLLAYLTPHISHTYLTPHISHTYPSHHTYPTHIHSKRIPPIRIRSTRIPPIRIHAMRIHSMRIHSKGVHQQESQTYPTNTYPTNTYLQHVSHQYGSIQCVSIQKVCISRNGNEYEYHCISFHTIATRREW